MFSEVSADPTEGVARLKAEPEAMKLKSVKTWLRSWRSFSAASVRALEPLIFWHHAPDCHDCLCPEPSVSA